MSTPLFLREPVIGYALAVAASTNAPLLLGPNAAEAVEEATLVEELIWFANDDTHSGGTLFIFLKNPAATLGAAMQIDIPSASGEFKTGRIRVDITLPVGWAMIANHDLSGTPFNLFALGGIVR